MSIGDAFRSALENLAAHKLRSALSMLGMIFGVGAVIAMLSIGAGAGREALEMIDRLGVRNILVRDRDLEEDELREIRKNSIGLSRRDMDAIVESVPGVELVTPRVEVDAYGVMGSAGTKTEARVYGVSHRHRALTGLEVTEGRFLDSLDENSHAQVCVVGPGVRRDLFGYEAALGGRLKVNDVWFEVVGQLAESGGGESFQGISVGSTAREIYLPFTTAIRKLERDPLEAPLDEIIVRLEADAPVRSTAQVLRGLLDRLHSGESDYDVVVPQALLEQSQQTRRLFNLVMGCIAGISLLVGGIGIMNIMLATVLERTREIGIRRATGARRADIRSQFIVESFSISLLGGLAGVVVGIAMARVIAAWAGWPTVITAGSIVISTGVSITVGLASGLYPAVRAAALDPVEALGYE